MQVDEAIRARRAIKWYDPEHQMPEETFLKLIERFLSFLKDELLSLKVE